MADPIVARAGSEYGRLRRVLVHTPGKERLGLQAWATLDMEPPAVAHLAEIQREHARIKALLTEALGSEAVLELTELLRTIFTEEVSSRGEILAEILGVSAPSFLEALLAPGRSLDDIEPSVIVEALLVPFTPSLLWVRDPAVCTPAGIVLHEMAQSHRRREPALMRAILRHHPLFAPASFFLDLPEGTGTGVAPATPVAWNLLDGGNTIVLGPGALAIGTPGPGAFEEFALKAWINHLLLTETSPRLERVYLVTVPAPFGHLDAVFNPFAPGAALAMPYLFGGPASISREQVSCGLREYQRWSLSSGNADPRPAQLGPQDFDDAGKVEIFSSDPARPGESRRVRGHLGFLEQLAEDGWLAPDTIAWIGGDRQDHESQANHLTAALREQSRQAGNLLALGPCDVMMSDDNPWTRRSLERTMARASRVLRLRLVSMQSLAACYGGCRCLTLPLLRDGE